MTAHTVARLFATTASCIFSLMKSNVVRATPGWPKVLSPTIVLCEPRRGGRKCYGPGTTPPISASSESQKWGFPLGACNRTPLSSFRYSSSPDPDSLNMGSSVISNFRRPAKCAWSVSKRPVSATQGLRLSGAGCVVRAGGCGDMRV